MIKLCWIRVLGLFGSYGAVVSRRESVGGVMESSTEDCHSVTNIISNGIRPSIHPSIPTSTIIVQIFKIPRASGPRASLRMRQKTTHPSTSSSIIASRNPPQISLDSFSPSRSRDTRSCPALLQYVPASGTPTSSHQTSYLRTCDVILSRHSWYANFNIRAARQNCEPDHGLLAAPGLNRSDSVGSQLNHHSGDLPA